MTSAAPRNYQAVLLVLMTFFVISFITNVMGPLFPALVTDFKISLTLAGFFPFAFFIAYGVMSIPAGILTEKYGEKPVLIMGFSLSALGAFLFTLYPALITALISLFLIGAAMAMLQVVINPLLRVAGGEEHFAFNSVLAQLIFGAGATLSPYVYTSLLKSLATQPRESWVSLLLGWVPENLSWLSMYGLFAVLSLCMLVRILVMRLPKIELADNEKAGALLLHWELLKNKQVQLFFIAIVAYVATEQGVANSLSLFLQKYHGFDPETVGATVVSEFWMLMTIGCFIGLGLLKLLDSRTVLKIFSVAAILSFLCALFADANVALLAFPAVGFFLSVMWSVIFSLALNSVPKYHGSFAGILCTGIIGGALISPIIGLIADLSGELRNGMLVILITLGYIFSIGFWAKPLVTNKTWRSEQAVS